MSRITQFFQPPLHWQDFEDLTVRVFEKVYGNPRPEKNGRAGQSQNGVDVYGYDTSGNLIAIQCKRMDELDENNNPRPGGVITKKILDDEILKVVKGFNPKPSTWILATTAKRDATIQKYVRKLNKKSIESGSFGIQIWFWDDYVSDLNRYYDLQEDYYRNVINIYSSDDQDEIILRLIAESFSRPAFQTPLHVETPDEFIDALKDTLCALNTGQLKDRETRRVIRSAVGGFGYVSDAAIKLHLMEAANKLSKLRTCFMENMRSGKISESGKFLTIPSDLQTELELLRSQAKDAVNLALAKASMSPI